MVRRTRWLHRRRTTQEWADEVRRLARARNATLLAHNYQLPAIQDVADHVGDSLALSRIAAEVDSDEIIFCGVHFMAETAKILSPEKRVLIPDERAGCSLADSITADELRAWKAEFPPDAVVVSYVNTTAEVKGLTDICCTSSNAVDVVASIDPDRDVLFLPDQFLGAHVKRETGRDNIHIWRVSATCTPASTATSWPTRPRRTPMPTFSSTPNAVVRPRLSTWRVRVPCPRIESRSSRPAACSTLLARPAPSRSSSPPRSACCTSCARPRPGVDFQAVNDRASCPPYMKMITPAALLRCLREGRDEVFVDTDVAEKARKSVERMIAIGNPGSGE